LVAATMHEVTVKNGLLTDVRYYLVIRPILSKPVLFFSRKVLVLEDQFTSPCPYYYYYGNRTQGTVVKTHTQKYNQIERKNKIK